MNILKVKKLYILIFLIPILLVSSPLEVKAQTADLLMSVSSNNPNVGDTVTVTVWGVAEGREVLSNVSVNYNPSVLEYVSATDTATNSGSGRLAYSTSRISITFKAIGSGRANLSASGSDAVEISNPGKTYESVTGAAAPVTVEGTSTTTSSNESKDNSLKSLTLSSGTLSPDFSYSTTSYSATVPNSTTKLQVSAVPSNNAAKIISVTGADSLSVGNNNVQIVVEAEDGSRSTYTVSVRREEVTPTPTQEPTQEETQEPSTEIELDGRGGKYILLPFDNSLSIPDNFIETTFTINDDEVNGWQLEGLEDEGFYIIYAMDSSGNTDLYNYDESGNTFQRFSVDAMNALLGKNTDEEAIIQDDTIQDDSDKSNQDLADLQSKYDKDMKSRLNILIAMVILSVILIIVLINVIFRNRFLKQDLLELEDTIEDLEISKKDDYVYNDSDLNIENQGYINDSVEESAIIEEQIEDDGMEINEITNEHFENVIPQVDDSVDDSLDETSYSRENLETTDNNFIEEVEDSTQAGSEDQIIEQKEEQKEEEQAEQNDINKTKDKASDLENATLEDIFKFLNIDDFDDDDIDDL